MKIMMLFLAAAACFAFGKAEAAMDLEGSGRPALWRTTETCHALNHVVLATGTIHLHSVQVTSATVNANSAAPQTASYFAMFNSTTRPNGGNSANFSTVTRVIPDMIATSNVLTWDPFEYDIQYSSGIVIQKAGAACIQIEWDYVLPRFEALVPWRP